MTLSCFKRCLMCCCTTYGAIGEEEFGALLVIEEGDGR